MVVEEVLAWLVAQDVLVNYVLKALVALACLKYILIGRR